MSIPTVSTHELKRHYLDIKENIKALQGKKLLVVGDVGLDEYVMGRVHRISPEAPVPVVDVSSKQMRLGLSANVAQNIKSLGGEPLLVGVIGKDKAGEQLKQALDKAQISSQFLFTDSQRPTTIKMRVMAKHHHIVRVDYERREFLSEKMENKLLEALTSLVSECEGVVLEDYGKGILSEKICQIVIGIALKQRKKVLVDPYKHTPITYYKGASLLKPNRSEAFLLAQVLEENLKQETQVFNKIKDTLLSKTQCQHVAVTLGGEGILLLSPKRVQLFPTRACEVFDVTGAGDTVLAALSLGWCSGLSLQASCVLANQAASVVVGQIGCGVCTLEQILKMTSEYLNKINSNKNT